MLLDTGDTIAALATAPGPGAIAVVRASGPDAVAAALKVFSPRPGERVAHRHVTLGSLTDPRDGIAFDEALLTFFRGPSSYTRQDLVEISCHGGSVAAATCLAALLREGCRLAEPGEFTLRAFLSGRIDLARAEAVADMVAAPNDLSLKSARAQLGGSLSESVRAIRERLIGLRAQLEAEIDFAEDDVPPMPRDQIGAVLESAQIRVAAALKGSETGQLLRTGVRITLVGAPNAGKSSTMNLLLGRDRAIVTEEAGTTRDVLEESLSVDGLTVVLSDTAGIRSGAGRIESEGIVRTERALGEADLALHLVDGSRPLAEADYQTAALIARVGLPAIVLLNKSDLGTVVGDAELERIGIARQVPFSALRGDGVDRLQEELSDLLETGGLRATDLPQTTNRRHIRGLRQAETELAGSERALRDGLPADFICIGLAGAISELGLITGEDATEDLLSAIFTKFCIGK
ncbi:MAG: tRNA uridine-5-carboxymethylaminomethyl(34) synthesis GTPase MnmE [Chloroflexi bacterium]|nr:tRNA uridine-5-carboxymethylaminomethyl(34) synthesis GTPase MnmE [Chloroflexota bacterium]